MKWFRNILVTVVLVFNSTAGLTATEAPDINLQGLDGEVDLDALAGKVVYLDFWASWCKPCMKSFPWMIKMKSKYVDQDFEILAVNLDSDQKLGDNFARKMKVNFLVGFDPQGETASRYELRGMPTSFLIGRDGKIYATHIGFRDKDKSKIEKAIKQLLVM
ncbi:MAG: TlpA family protein disulfide reductase [Gammaproteobacteria bacterium]|nr:TlpA family protein disulfide reductase [Gammaproteobacteria bacterium]